MLIRCSECGYLISDKAKICIRCGNSDFKTFNIKNEVLYDYIGNDASIVIPNNVKKIGKYAFAGNKDLYNICIPDGIKEIEHDAFLHCENLLNINLPNGITKIGTTAFGFCKNLSAISIPTSTEEIGRNIFWGCTNLENIVIPRRFKDKISIAAITLFDTNKNLNITYI